MLNGISERRARINAFSFNVLHRLSGLARQGVLSLDRLLRRSQKIVTDPEQDLLRIAIRGSTDPVPLADGMVAANDRIIELHLWNERLQGMGRFGPGLRWGARMRRRMHRSFALLAQRLEDDPALIHCAAIRAEIVLPDRRSIAKLGRLAGRFGFQQQGEAAYPGFGRSLLALALAWAFNPGSLKAIRLKPACAVFWVSVPNFRKRYRQSLRTSPAKGSEPLAV